MKLVCDRRVLYTAVHLGDIRLAVRILKTHKKSKTLTLLNLSTVSPPPPFLLFLGVIANDITGSGTNIDVIASCVLPKMRYISEGRLCSCYTGPWFSFRWWWLKYKLALGQTTIEVGLISCVKPWQSWPTWCTVKISLITSQQTIWRAPEKMARTKTSGYLYTSARFTRNDKKDTALKCIGLLRSSRWYFWSLRIIGNISPRDITSTIMSLNKLWSIWSTIPPFGRWRNTKYLK